LASSRLHAAPGDQVASMKAACDALDIEPLMPD